MRITNSLSFTGPPQGGVCCGCGQSPPGPPGPPGQPGNDGAVRFRLSAPPLYLPLPFDFSPASLDSRGKMGQMVGGFRGTFDSTYSQLLRLRLLQEWNCGFNLAFLVFLHLISCQECAPAQPGLPGPPGPKGQPGKGMGAFGDGYSLYYPGTPGQAGKDG